MNRTVRQVKKQSGVVAIVMALMLPVLIGILGIVVDLGFAFQYKRTMQTAADAAALAGAHSIYRNETSDVTINALYDAGKNGFDGSRGETRTVNLPPLSGDFAGQDDFVEVLISEQLGTFFMPVLGINNMTVSARAVAGARVDSAGCVYVLSGDASKALEVSSGSELIANSCKVKVSSCNDPEALSVTSSSEIQAVDIDVCGSVDCSGSTCDPTPNTGECDGSPCDDGEDPLGGLTQPTVPGGCPNEDFIDFKTSSEGTPGSPVQIYEGTYCNGISIESGSYVHFNSGTYFLKGGGLNIDSASVATGDSVTFYNTEGGGYDFKPFEIQSGSHVEFSAQQGSSYGDLDGMLFWQDRYISGDWDNKIESNTSSFFEGTIYIPTQHVMFHSNTSGEGGAAWTAIVSDTLEGGIERHNPQPGG